MRYSKGKASSPVPEKLRAGVVSKVLVASGVLIVIVGGGGPDAEILGLTEELTDLLGVGLTDGETLIEEEIELLGDLEGDSDFEGLKEALLLEVVKV